MTGLYLRTDEEGEFHTLIIKHTDGDLTYLAALGYAGGGECAEFYGRFRMDDEGNIHGAFSPSTGSGEWEQKVMGMDFNADTERFDLSTEELYELMESDEMTMQSQLLDILGSILYWGYDEDTEQEYEYPSIKAIGEVGLVEMESAPGVFTNANWNDEWLEVTCSDVWGLSLSFPHVTEAYL